MKSSYSQVQSVIETQAKDRIRVTIAEIETQLSALESEIADQRASVGSGLWQAWLLGFREGSDDMRKLKRGSGEGAGE